MAFTPRNSEQAQQALDIRMVIDAIPTLAWSARSDGSADFFNQRWLDYTGLSASEACDWGWTVALHPDDLDGLVDYWRSVLVSGTSGEIEGRLRRYDGVYRWFLFRATPSFDNDGNVAKWFGTNTDIEDRKNAEALLAGENLVLEMTAKGRPLESILEALCRVVEQTSSGCCCSILLIDPGGSKIERAVAPSLPSSYNDHFPGTLVDREGGPCTEAAIRKKQVIVSDVASDSRWDTYGWRTAALTHGLKACWSTTILASNGLVLGTFAVYWREPRSPTEQDQKIIEQMTHLASVAIERKRNETALQQSESRFRLIVDAVPGLVCTLNATGEVELLNRQVLEYFGKTLNELKNWATSDAVHPDDLPRVIDSWRRSVETGEPHDLELRQRRADGVYRWFQSRALPSRDAAGHITGWYMLLTDIDDRKRAEALLAAEKLTLEMIANGARIGDILESLCNTIDAQADNIISAVMLMDSDGMRLWPAASPRLPKSWVEAITPLKIGPCVGSCGTAASLKQRVIVSDIAADPLWLDYRDVALSHGLRAAWSQPLLSKDQQVLGTFGMYYKESRTPSESDLRLIEGAGHIAVIAIEGERSQAALRRAFEEIAKSEAELRTIIDAIPQLIVAIGVDGQFLSANQAVLEYTGLTKEEMKLGNFREVFHPEDLERLRDERAAAISRGAPFEYELRIRGNRDGQYRWFLIQYNPLRGERGEIIRWYATGIDIDERKHAEERTRQENFALREQIDQVFMFEEIVGSSPALKTVLSSIVKVAPTDSTVLIAGETGTGKELIARAIHKGSQRAGQAFITVNCGAIPSSLIASELFGHEKGAFTGALQRRQGRFELAHSGTIFLDEIGELPHETQIALLRVLQERQFERVGSSRVISTDVRIIAATNRDLSVAIASGTFRADLFYRLNVFPIQVPPLRNRREDIPMLVEYFVKRYAEKTRKQISKIDKNTLQLCQAYPWPGNIRELQNIIERSVILCTGDTFSIDEAWLSSRSAPRPGSSALLTQTLLNHEKELIEAALAESRGKVAGPNGAAAKLGIPRSTLELKIKQLNIKKHAFR
jgi:PAS domain S-box-containing protein